MNHNIETIGRLCMAAYKRGFMHGMITGGATVALFIYLSGG